jgi:hypothetical protein
MCLLDCPSGTQPNWIFNGSTFIDPSTIAPPAPTTATNAQIRAALLKMPGSAPGRSLLQEVDEAINAAGIYTEIFQMWNSAAEVNRTGPLVQALAAQFGMSEAALEAMFAAAVLISG